MIGVFLKNAGAALCVALLLSACAPTTAERYRNHARIMQSDGYFRTETTPADAPFTNADLARNFEKVALNREYRRENGALVEAETPTPISRWTKPLRYRLAGEGVTPVDILEYRAFTQRLQGLTGLPVSEVKEEPNISILILGPEEREEFIASLEEDGLADRLPLVVEWAREVRYPCIGQVGYQDADSGEISGAMIVIKAELQGVFRTSCIHEELTQALGLMNDDDEVRPSIFNDDQEFAFLTEHDEYLIRILYDGRLRPGMAAEEVRAVLPEILAEMRPEGEG